MSEWRRIALAVCAIAALAGANCFADTVLMKNGDRITGVVKSLDDGILTIESVHFGTVTVDYSEVASLRIEGARGVSIKGGTRIVGTLDLQAGESAAMETDSGAWEVPAADVTAIGPVELAEAEAPAWHGSFQAGLGGQTGNSETFRGNAALDLKRESPDLLITGYALARYAEEEGERSENVQGAGGRSESTLSRRDFWYSSVDLRRDELKDLELRTTAVVGLGRAWWKEDANYWKTRAGVGFTHEAFTDGSDDIFPVAQLAGDYGKRINSRLTFTDSIQYIQELDDFRGWRATNDAALSVDLSENGNWQLKLGLLNEYDNSPPDDIDELDTYYYLNALRKF